MTKKITLVLYLLLITVLAVATLVEHSRGSAFVAEHIYHSVPFILLWGVLGVLMIFSLWKKTFLQVWPKILLHLSFLVILAGALTTYLTSRKGMMHLRMGEPSFQYMEGESRLIRSLPFTLELDTFYIDYYPGTDAPADYVSVVKVGTKAPSNSPKGGEFKAAGNDATFPLGGDRGGLALSMNNILSHKGYRFYQSSYDEDCRGTWLSVNYDPWGTAVTYAGYLLLLISMIGLMVHPRGGFRLLLRKVVSFTILFAFTSGTFAQETQKLPIIPLEEAEEKTDMQVIYHDRVVPLNTLARDFVKKLYGKDSFSGLTPEQILLSWQRYPQEWAYVPAIKIKSEELRARLGVKENHVRMVDLFAQGDYRLRQWWQTDNDGNKPSPLQKAITETDEKVALILMLQRGTLIRPLPQDGSVEPLSETRLKAELLYNSIPFTKILFMFNLTMGIILLWTLTGPSDPIPYRPSPYRPSPLPLHKGGEWNVLLVIVRVFTPSPWGRQGWGPKVGMGSEVLRFFLLLLSLLFHLSGYLLRWYIGGRIPLSNGYETMQFLALCIMAFALLISRRYRQAVGFGFLLSGFTLLVSYLGEMNPQITPLMPVLVSPWLSLHVSVIMMAYALFAFVLLNGVWALCVPREAERLMTYSRLMLYPAVFLLTAGIFIGAVWANVSWGRYWGWDPKEVWALITMLIYALPLHTTSLPWFRKPRFFHIYTIAAFLSVLITYFGVNFFLGGMHSYA